MNNDENFLSRWARRKSEAGSATPPAREQETASPVADPQPTQVAVVAEEPPLTADDLPSLDSITAETDIRPFLQPNVPSELSRAALRKLWVADPAIRDFVGLAENAWDFTKPGAVPGFGPLAPQEIARLASDLMATMTSSAPETTAEITAAREVPLATQEADRSERTEETSDSLEPEDQPTNDAGAGDDAPQKDLVRREATLVQRPHGSALPK